MITNSAKMFLSLPNERPVVGAECGTAVWW